MPAADNTIADKIAALLKVKDSDTASQAEIMAAMKQAARLMRNHNLREEDLTQDHAQRLNDIDNATFDKSRVWMKTKIYMWELMLQHYVLKLVPGVQAYEEGAQPIVTEAGIVRRTANGKPKKGKAVTFFGVAEDVAIASRVFSELLQVIFAMAHMKYGGAFKGDGAVYAEGFVKGLQGQLEQDDIDAEKDARQKLLANDNRQYLLISRRNDIATRKVSAARNWLATPAGGGVRLKRTMKGGGASGSSSARAAGRADGSRYNVDASRRAKLAN